MDWGIGNYEHTAAEIAPAAERVVALAAVAPGERVLDVACGTGNAALAAASAGGEVTGVDGAPRLIEIARERAAVEGLDAAFVVGDAQALPFAGASFDVVLSVFGVIFAADAERAFVELVRVLRPGGRALVSAWLPHGAIGEAIGALSRAVAAATGAPDTRFAWHDSGSVRALAARHDVAVDFADERIVFAGESPEEYMADWQAHNPAHIEMRAVLERAGTHDEARARALAALRAGNEDPGAFRVTSDYRVAVVWMPP